MPSIESIVLAYFPQRILPSIRHKHQHAILIKLQHDIFRGQRKRARDLETERIIHPFATVAQMYFFITAVYRPCPRYKLLLPPEFGGMRSSYVGGM
ncbi:hypothetical protein RRF57_011652 [Xylaria bambusicola]|uniref:Uncharacterized protein n=1 Tax=Xylaria bambusicola TaxID=326684 RepID=A0AAN7V0V9_9PEZI